MSIDKREMDIDPILQDALLTIRSVSDFIASHVDKVSTNDIEEKEMNSLVSFVDKEAEHQLVNGLSKLISSAGFITEEDTEDQKGKEYTWIIDPLDGTTNFLNKVPHFAISVALQRHGVTILGVVKEVNSGEEWTAIQNQGAYLNGAKISVNSKPFNDILVATGFPYSNEFDYDAYFKILKHWLTHTRGMRRLGSAALDLCYVACGRLGAYYEATLNAWDVAAGALIVKEAGGIVSDFMEGDDYLYGREILAASPTVYSDVHAVIASHLTKN
ncbi:MAG: inositol monophosphatase family protein [Saprospiraceae bacterium]|nr:inositol monophosphatase family protein [Saprospiraceae bacterium]